MRKLAVLCVGLLILSGFSFLPKKKPRSPGFTDAEIHQAVSDCENKTRSLEPAAKHEAGASKMRSLTAMMKKFTKNPFAKSAYDKCMEAKGFDRRSIPQPDPSQRSGSPKDGSSHGPLPGACFSTGASQTRVIEIMGVPDRVEKIQREDWFWYENSYVQFDPGDKVKCSYNAGNLKRCEDVSKNAHAPAGAAPKAPQDPSAEAIVSALQRSAQGDHDAAIILLNKALLAYPSHAEIYIVRANMYAKQGLYEKAVADSDAAIAVDPKNPMAYAARAEIYGREGKHDLAISDLTRALELKPEDLEAAKSKGFPNTPDKRVFDLSVLEKRGEAYLKIKEFDNAIADFTEAMEGNPDTGSLEGNYCNRAEAYMDKFVAVNKDTGSAVTDASCGLAMKDLGKALQLNPDSARAYRYRAILHLWRKEYDKSWDDVHRARSLGSDVQGALLDQLKKASGRQK